jgi:hypothetical protein
MKKKDHSKTTTPYLEDSKQYNTSYRYAKSTPSPPPEHTLEAVVTATNCSASSSIPDVLIPAASCLRKQKCS